MHLVISGICGHVDGLFLRSVPQLQKGVPLVCEYVGLYGGVGGAGKCVACPGVEIPLFALKNETKIF